MAQETINVGAAANDGTGDPLRTAFEKCNDNFTELYGVTISGRSVVTITFYDNVGVLLNMVHDPAPIPYPDALDPGGYVLDFVPTNYRFSYHCGGSTVATDCVWDFQWSTDGTTWTSADADIDATTAAVGTLVTGAGTLTIPGSPALVYIQLVSKDTHATDDCSCDVRLMTLTLWTGAAGSAPTFNSFWMFNADDSLYYEVTLVGPGGQFSIDQTGQASPP